MCPHESVLFAARAIAARLSYRDSDVVLCRLPLAFDYGLYQVFLSTMATSHLVLCGPSDGLRLVQRAHEVGATVMPIMPSIAKMLLPLLERSGEVPPIRLMTNTGEALEGALIDRLRQALPDMQLCLMFGMTECKRISIAAPDEDLVAPDAVGTPLDGTSVVVVDDDDTELPDGQPGQFVVTGPHVMAGYWRSPELTASVFEQPEMDGPRVLYTGDYGFRDSVGRLYFVGRRDHTFKLGGLRTSTTEIEAAALDIEGVDAAVLLPPSSQGPAVLAVVGDLKPVDVLRALRQRLAAEKVPPRCEVLTELPRTLNEKVDRRAVERAIRG